VSYTPRTVWVPGIRWPGTETPWVTYPVSKKLRPLSKETQALIDHIRDHEWRTASEISRAMKANRFRVAGSLPDLHKTGRLVAKMVPSAKGEAWGYAINPA